MTTKPKALELAARCESLSRDISYFGAKPSSSSATSVFDEAAAELRRQHEVIGELVRLGAAVLKELDEDQPDAPGHCHSRPGVWDDENEFRVAGQPCQWCATWGQFRALLNKHKE